MNRLRRLLALPRGRQALLLACAWALLLAAWRVRTWPFARLAADLGRPAAPGAVACPGPVPGAAGGLPAADNQTSAHDVRWAVAAWVRAWPWPPTCLMQALAARGLLARQGVACDLVFGVRGQATEAARKSSEIGAHAWLLCGSLLVTGEAEAANFQPIAVYRFRPGGASSQA